MNWRERFGISGSTLKFIAIITMLIDHTGATVVYALTRQPYITANPETLALVRHLYTLMRDIGRIAFPIFCFLLVEGFLHTHDVKKYASRMFLFALISEIPFDFALKPSWFYPSKQNVYFTLLIGLLVLWGITACYGKIVLQLLILVAGLLAANLLQTDYSYKGVFLIEVLYLFRFSKLYQCLGGAAAISWEVPAPIAFIPVFFYNGKRGISLKYFFYWFYPVHLVLLGIITKCILPMFA
ncbi:MAG: TraX family protein [Lachnospiraceae bacterium]|nr:TraX family protein [Lachnospiraceae bacterium]MDD3794510.1 TraX family protein [Lachnospiraceae bacterium]